MKEEEHGVQTGLSELHTMAGARTLQASVPAHKSSPFRVGRLCSNIFPKYSHEPNPEPPSPLTSATPGFEPKVVCKQVGSGGVGWVKGRGMRGAGCDTGCDEKNRPRQRGGFSVGGGIAVVIELAGKDQKEQTI